MSRYLIIGGAGFIGVNAASHYARQNHVVTVLDNFSRRGTTQNVDWLHQHHTAIRVVNADIRTDHAILKAETERCDVLLHLAAQVAVTTSVADPRTDFEINALGSLNVLEAARLAPRPPIVLYSSTNKVYGEMEDLPVVLDGRRYRYDASLDGISENRCLDFHSPYGCSKGAADQYARDYARIFGLRTIVFRQSCIYGPHQFGIEDQGWIAWFALRSLLGKPVTIYGDGKQVRDVLYVDDLIGAFDAAIENIDVAAGKAYNMGGGPQNTLSLLELLDLLETLNGAATDHSFSDWRPGDQRIYISDVRRAQREFGWVPKTCPEQGLKQMLAWMRANQEVVVRLYQG